MGDLDINKGESANNGAHRQIKSGEVFVMIGSQQPDNWELLRYLKALGTENSNFYTGLESSASIPAMQPLSKGEATEKESLNMKYALQNYARLTGAEPAADAASAFERMAAALHGGEGYVTAYAVSSGAIESKRPLTGEEIDAYTSLFKRLEKSSGMAPGIFNDLSIGIMKYQRQIGRAMTPEELHALEPSARISARRLIERLMIAGSMAASQGSPLSFEQLRFD